MFVFRQVSRQRVDNAAGERQVGLGDVCDENEETPRARWQRRDSGQSSRAQRHAEDWHSHRQVKVVYDKSPRCGASSAIWDNSPRVTCHPPQVNAPRFNSSQTGGYLIYLRWRDERLSWPWCWWLRCFTCG